MLFGFNVRSPLLDCFADLTNAIGPRTNFDRGKRGGPRVCEMSETDLWARFVGNPGHMASFVVYAQATWWNGNFCYTVVSLFITYYPLTIITHFFVIDK